MERADRQAPQVHVQAQGRHLASLMAWSEQTGRPRMQVQKQPQITSHTVGDGSPGALDGTSGHAAAGMGRGEDTAASSDTSHTNKKPAMFSSICLCCSAFIRWPCEDHHCKTVAWLSRPAAAAQERAKSADNGSMQCRVHRQGVKEHVVVSATSRHLEAEQDVRQQQRT